MTDQADCENGKVARSGYDYKKDFRTALPQFIAVSVKNLLLLAYGMTLGFPTILIPAVSNPTGGETLKLDASEISWIGSLNLIVVPAGCALSGVVTTPLGRRRSMQLVNVPFFIAWLLLHYATSSAQLYGALALTGLAGGLLEAPVLTYVAEVTQPHLRGALTASSSMCIIIGVFTQFLFGLIFYWRTVALVNITFTIVALIALCFVPESPHWLVSRNRFDDARKSLQWLRGWTTPCQVEDELKDIKTIFNKKAEESISGTYKNKQTWMQCTKENLSNYTDRSFLMPYLLVSFAFFVGHFCGMTTLQTYAVKIFQILQAPIDKYYATLILGVVQIVGSLTCVLLVHYTGKRPLAIVSTVGTGLCCLVVAGYDYYIQSNSSGLIEASASITFMNVTSLNTTEVPLDVSQDQQYSWIPLTFLMLLAGLSHIGTRLLPWILIGEVFSARTRSGASGLSSAIGYVFAFLSNKFFISMLNSLSIKGTYGLYGFISLSGAVVFYFILPETEGKKLVDIENHFAGIKRLTNEVYRSKRNIGTKGPTNCKGTANPSFELESSKL